MEKDELLTKFHQLFGTAMVQERIRNGLLNPETRSGVLLESGFDDEEIEKMMPIKAEDLPDFAVQVSEIFPLIFSSGKERKEN